VWVQPSPSFFYAHPTPRKALFPGEIAAFVCWIYFPLFLSVCKPLVFFGGQFPPPIRKAWIIVSLIPPHMRCSIVRFSSTFYQEVEGRRSPILPCFSCLARSVTLSLIVGRCSLMLFSSTISYPFPPEERRFFPSLSFPAFVFCFFLSCCLC